MIDELIDDEESVFESDLDAFSKILENQALNYIKIFFKKRKFHCGGPIPSNRLYSQSSINIVLSTPFSDGTDEIYSIMPKIPCPEGYNEAKLPWDVHRYLRILSKVSAYGIPKIFQTGMILLYYKFCHGCRIQEKKLNITHIME